MASVSNTGFVRFIGLTPFLIFQHLPVKISPGQVANGIFIYYHIKNWCCQWIFRLFSYICRMRIVSRGVHAACETAFDLICTCKRKLCAAFLHRKITKRRSALIQVRCAEFFVLITVSPPVCSPPGLQWGGLPYSPPEFQGQQRPTASPRGSSSCSPGKRPFPGQRARLPPGNSPSSGPYRTEPPHRRHFPCEWRTMRSRS